MAPSAPSFVQADIPIALRGHVESITAYDVHIGAGGSHIGLPSTTLTMQLTSGAPLRVGWGSQRNESRPLTAMLAGLHSRPAHVFHDGRMTGVEVALTTRGIRALCGLPAAELAEIVVSPDEVDSALGRMIEQVALSTTPAERLRHTLGGLSEIVRAADPMRAEVDHALTRLWNGGGVERIAHEAGLSRRHLTSLVRSEIGMSPKGYQRVARFERAHTMLEDAARVSRPSLARIAAWAGYSDQAHMTREWSKMAGIPPGAWLRTEFPLMQDPSSD